MIVCSSVQKKTIINTDVFFICIYLDVKVIKNTKVFKPQFLFDHSQTFPHVLECMVSSIISKCFYIQAIDKTVNIHFINSIRPKCISGIWIYLQMKIYNIISRYYSHENSYKNHDMFIYQAKLLLFVAVTDLSFTKSNYLARICNTFLFLFSCIFW